MKKKIILFYPHIEAFGGIERLILSLINEINQKKYEYELVCFYNKVNFKSKKINIVNLNCYNLVSKIFYLKKYILTQPKNFNLLAWGEKGSFFCFFSGVKNYSIHYDDPPFLYNKLENFSLFKKYRKKISLYFCKQGLINAKNLITQTEKNKQDFKKIFKVNFRVLYPGGNNFSSNYVKKIDYKKKINFVSIGRLSKNRNIDWLIEFMLFLKVEKLSIFSKSRLHICGDGEEKKLLISKCNKHQTKNKIFFHTFINDNKIKKLLNKNSIGLIPAVQGYGLPALEFLYCGIPIVINKASRISEILKKNPWVTISKNDKNNFFKNTIKMINKFSKSMPKNNFLDKLPSSKKWTHDIGKVCQWW